MSKQNGVKPLADLFTVVIGLSLTIALQGIIDPKATFPLRVDIFPNFIAFIVTILPFTHGAITHLMTAYEDADDKLAASASLLIDYFILFLNGCFFIGWAILLPTNKFATITYICILALDAVWGVLAKIFTSRSSVATPSLTWAAINAATAVILLLSVLLFIGPIYKAGWDVNVSYAIALVAMSRTVVDYCLTWRFYIGEGQQTGKPRD